MVCPLALKVPVYPLAMFKLAIVPAKPASIVEFVVVVLLKVTVVDAVGSVSATQFATVLQFIFAPTPPSHVPNCIYCVVPPPPLPPVPPVPLLVPPAAPLTVSVPE